MSTTQENPDLKKNGQFPITHTISLFQFNTIQLYTLKPCVTLQPLHTPHEKTS